MDLVDLPVVGNRFTWFNSSGRCKSRLDIFLVSEDRINRWKLKAQCVCDRDISDHRPVWLKSNNLNWGPKLFKVFNSWMEHPEFLKFVRYCLNSFTFSGTSTFIIKEKFKALWDKLRWWNLNIFGLIDLRIQEGVVCLNEIERDMLQDRVKQSIVNIKKRSEAWELI
ncbi:unnamed protein product [Lathyrus sativus]|nr:unnamed protein product [Lathyrus sativus]